MLIKVMGHFFRSGHRRCSVKKSVLKNFANFTGKHQCCSFFLIKLLIKLLIKFRRTSPVAASISKTVNLIPRHTTLSHSQVFSHERRPFPLVFPKCGLLMGSLAKYVELVS